jgi:alkaline phosphatase D
MSDAQKLSPSTQAHADTDRRQFLRLGSAGALVAGSGLLVACGSDSDPQARDPNVLFLDGVASGDPLADRVILWTRITPQNNPPQDVIEVRWEVSTSNAFSSLVAQGSATTSAGRDWTVKVDAMGLAAGTVYFYRFTAGRSSSAIGRTKTLPTGGVSQVKFAVFSCSNFPAGYFNVYAEAAKATDIDCALHLGDYIYEYNRAGYASAQAASLGRLSEPDAELITLADYRRRYRQYRSDGNLQSLHAAMPMICIWDDHEVANNAWLNGAENHTPGTEGEWVARRTAALQAWYEWMPVRQPDASNALRSYRSFDFGSLVSLHMLDTRLIGRDLQLSINSYVGAGGAFDGARFASDVGNPNRQLLGATQTNWLQQRMQASSATWQLLGQQVLMGRMNVPAPLLLGQITVSGYAALAQRAQTNPGSLTPQEQAILAAPAIPYNLDAWDGYAAARETVLGMARTLDKNLVVVAGDTHNAWANDLLDAQGNRIGVEFATPSVSSPGFEGVFPNENPVQFAAALEQLIGPLQYADTSRRGFLTVTFTATEARADWTFVSTITDRTYTAAVGRSLRTLPGAANRRLVSI